MDSIESPTIPATLHSPHLNQIKDTVLELTDTDDDELDEDLMTPMLPQSQMMASAASAASNDSEGSGLSGVWHLTDDYTTALMHQESSQSNLSSPRPLAISMGMGVNGQDTVSIASGRGGMYSVPCLLWCHYAGL